MIGATGDGAREDGKRLGSADGERRGGGDANADCVGGAAVEAEDDVTAASSHRPLCFKVPHLAVSVPLHRREVTINLDYASI